MTEPNLEDENNFVLNFEQLDALRLDAESVSPPEKNDFDRLVVETHRRFLDRMSPFVAKNYDEGLGGRFILVDEVSNEHFQRNWHNPNNKMVHYYGNGIGTYRAYNKEGGFVVGVPIDLWARLSVENKQRFIKKYGDEKLANQFVNKAFRINCIMHEITHLYQKPNDLFSAPLWFVECQAYWAARELVDKNIQVRITEYDKKADFYQHLLDKYGERIHGISMSGNIDLELFARLVDEFTPEVQHEIFPDFKFGELYNT